MRKNVQADDRCPSFDTGQDQDNFLETKNLTEIQRLEVKLNHFEIQFQVNCKYHQFFS